MQNSRASVARRWYSSTFTGWYIFMGVILLRWRIILANAESVRRRASTLWRNARAEWSTSGAIMAIMLIRRGTAAYTAAKLTTMISGWNDPRLARRRGSKPAGCINRCRSQTMFNWGNLVLSVLTQTSG